MLIEGNIVDRLWADFEDKHLSAEAGPHLQTAMKISFVMGIQMFIGFLQTACQQESPTKEDIHIFALKLADEMREFIVDIDLELITKEI